MKNRIKPEQYEPYEMITPSGNLVIESGINSFNFYLPETLTGDFNFDGTLKVNDMPVIYPNDTNNIFNYENGNRIFAGSNNIVSGNNCIILSASNSTVYGENNIMLFGQSSDINSVSNSLCAGKNIAVNHNGSFVFADSTSNYKSSIAENSVIFDFTGGFFVDNAAYFSSSLSVGNSLNVTGNIFCGNSVYGTSVSIASSLLVGTTITATGALSCASVSASGGAVFNNTVVITGQNAVTFFDLNTKTSQISGFVTGNYVTNTRFNTYTGGALATINNAIDSSLPVYRTGIQEISGEKTFKSTTDFCDGMTFLSSNNCTRYVPTTSTSTGERGRVAYSGRFLYIATGDNMWGRIQISTW